MHWMKVNNNFRTPFIAFEASPLISYFSDSNEMLVYGSNTHPATLEGTTNLGGYVTILRSAAPK